MKTIPATSRQFGISQISVWQLIRTHGIKSKAEFSMKWYATHYCPMQIKADMSLIAAAPELLDALENLVHLHGCEQEGIACGQPTAKQWIDAVDAAEKAIDKAKGE